MLVRSQFPFFIVAIVPNDAAITLWNTVPEVGYSEISAYVLGGKCVYFSVTHTHTHTHSHYLISVLPYLRSVYFDILLFNPSSVSSNVFVILIHFLYVCLAF